MGALQTRPYSVPVKYRDYPGSLNWLESILFRGSIDTRRYVGMVDGTLQALGVGLGICTRLRVLARLAGDAAMIYVA